MRRAAGNKSSTANAGAHRSCRGVVAFVSSSASPPAKRKRRRVPRPASGRKAGERGGGPPWLDANVAATSRPRPRFIAMCRPGACSSRCTRNAVDHRPRWHCVRHRSCWRRGAHRLPGPCQIGAPRPRGPTEQARNLADCRPATPARRRAPALAMAAFSSAIASMLPRWPTCARSTGDQRHMRPGQAGEGAISPHGSCRSRRCRMPRRAAGGRASAARPLVVMRAFRAQTLPRRRGWCAAFPWSWSCRRCR